MLPDMQLNRRSRFARDTKSDMEGSWVILGNKDTYCNCLKATLHLKVTFTSLKYLEIMTGFSVVKVAQIT